MIEITDVSTSIDAPGRGRIPVLRDVGLTLMNGDFVTVIGTNGSGKSTLLNAIAGVTKLDRGSIRIEGKNVTGQPEYLRARLIGRVYQNPFQGTSSNLTVAENLRIAQLRGRQRRLKTGLNSGLRHEFAEALTQFGMGLENKLNSPISSLTVGQRQAITLVMATMSDPKIILLDEHTSMLDPRSAEQILMMTDDLVRQHGVTTLMVTHSMSQALSVGNRTIMLDQGRLTMDISGSERQAMRTEDLLDLFGELHRREYMGNG